MTTNIFGMADTWNSVGTTFNAILMNASNGAGGSALGAAASRLINLQNNGTSVFSVDISGNLFASGVLGTTTVPTAVSSAAVTISNSIDGAGNLGHRIAFSFNGVTYWIPCGATAF